MQAVQLLQPELLRIAPNFDRQLRRVCEGIIAGAREGRPTPPAAEWLLGNYTYLRTQIREVRESLPRGFYKRLPRNPGGHEPRIFTAIEQAIAANLDTLDPDTLLAFFEQWQQHTTLKLSELWAIRPTLKIALLKQLAAAVTTGALDSPEVDATVRRVIVTFRRLDDVTWPEFVESLCLIDRLLRADPAGAYPHMDFETRDRYRRAVEEIARLSRSSELEVATSAIDLARQGELAVERHVGYFLIDRGLPRLRRAAHSRRTVSNFVRDSVRAVPNLIYMGGAGALTAALLYAAFLLLRDFCPVWFLLLLVLPASQAALTLVNLLVSYFLQPQVLPRMDFRNGIPDDARAIVVVPTLLLSKPGIQQLINNLEIYYLANRDSNLFFALLTDLPDAAQQSDREESPLVAFCVAGIRELNRRYRSGNREPFFLFHRDSEWNAREGKWMGRERKRGKLDDFNRLLLGRDNPFSRTVGSLEQIGNTRYVITLDSDTQLPRDTAWKLVGTMAHPLNRPVFDERKGIVRQGYSLMQPRIGISMESAGKSRFSALYSGQVGFDPYTKAVSDVYQDLFGRATFTGKGIYDVAAFDRATTGRFPDNTLLSHDLIEGEHVRAGLVTDLEMIDDYPSRYQAFSKRKHRWVRGDWQIAMWLLPFVPNSSWNWAPNPLPLVSRWKIFDNLRRSLVEPSYLLAFLCAWFVLSDDSVAATLVTGAFLLIPIYGELVISLFRLPPLRFFQAWVWTRFSDFIRAHIEAFLMLVFLPAQALLMFDAVLRTLYRRIISHRNLLEWESMAQAEMAGGGKFEAADLFSPTRLLGFLKSWNMPERYLGVSVVLAIFLWMVLASVSSGSDYPAFALVLAWIASPAMVAWLNTAPHRGSRHRDESEFLRTVALATWRYFIDHEAAEDHWLVPDNIQEDPPAVAHRTSPTNIGLQLNAILAAHQFGYITHQQFAQRVARVNSTLAVLERDRGHFFNWYDTLTLQVLPPRFLSTVDSGNLAASLIVSRQGSLAVLKQPLIGHNTFDSLRDHLTQLRNAVPVSARTPSIVRLVDNIRRQLASEPDDLFFWEGVLTEVRSIAHDLSEQIEWTASKLSARAPQSAQEIRYWLGQFNNGVQNALTGLCELAPWLCGAFETELRLNLNNPRLATLMDLLRPVPQLGKMSSVYASVEAEIHRLSDEGGPIHGSTLAILKDLHVALRSARERWRALDQELRGQAKFLGELNRDMEFRFLVDERRHLLNIGWDAEAGKLAPSFYDLLASEARTAVFVAIARGDAPLEAWFHLGRKLTFYRGQRTLVSWSGTMFEYLMPALFMQTWEGTLLGESLRSVVRIQQLYARERRVPWGISESAHSGRDALLNYQYRAFGIPSCGADRILPDDLVIAPYATVLALMIDPTAAVENLRQMASRGWLARYGFYEAVDFRRGPRGQRKPEVIRAFMAHHQGMSFLALANVLLDKPIQKFFHSDPAVMATELLLQERMPTMAEAQAPEEPFPGLSPDATGIADDLVARTTN